jgi:hypothetical protein
LENVLVSLTEFSVEQRRAGFGVDENVTAADLRKTSLRQSTIVTHEGLKLSSSLTITRYQSICASVASGDGTHAQSAGLRHSAQR